MKEAESSILWSGAIALGVLIGVIAAIFYYISFSGCASGETSLWLCDEEPEVVVGVLDFLKSIVLAVAWPLTVIVVFALFRAPITLILSEGRVSSFEFFNFKLNFREALEKAEEQVGEGIIEGDLSDTPPSERFMMMKDSNQKYSILAAWIELESQIYTLYEITRASGTPDLFRPSDGRYQSTDGEIRRSARKPIRIILRELEVPDSIYSAILELQRARNEVAHNSRYQVDESDIVRFLDIAANLDRYLSKRIREMRGE